MKNKNKFILVIGAVVVICLVAYYFVKQQKIINNLAFQVNDLNDKVGQNSLAAQTALSQTSDFLQAVEEGQAKAAELQSAWENRRPIGFKRSEQKG